jgi:hypothetical protein
VTLVLIALLGGVFLKGFTEAIGIAVGLVAVYLAFNLIVVTVALEHLVANPDLVANWQQLLTTSYRSPLAMVAVALLVFPKLALGLSGFETGVAVMPLVRGNPDGPPERPRRRIRNTRKLLTTAAVIMSGFLITSSFATTVLIPHQQFEDGGQASGRALAYLAHQYLGSGFGTAYDLSTISILWFAGASAMAGLLNIVPRYLPRYGMAPEWTRAVRPLALAFMAIAFAITIIFRADVESQAGAYATGVLVLMFSAAVAVTLSVRRGGRRPTLLAFGLITLVFAYTTIANVIERPDGVKIASFFIAAILATSLISRVTRATELRVTEVRLDQTARQFVEQAAADGELRLIANEPHARDLLEYFEKEQGGHLPVGGQHQGPQRPCHLRRQLPAQLTLGGQGLCRRPPPRHAPSPRRPHPRSGLVAGHVGLLAQRHDLRPRQTRRRTATRRPNLTQETQAHLARQLYRLLERTATNPAGR